MRHVEIDMPHLLVTRKHHDHDLGRLDEVHRLETVQVKGGNAGRRAARMRCKGDLSGEHFRVVLFHSPHDPRFQIWIAEIGDEERGLPAARGRLGVGDAGMGGIIAHWARNAGTWHEFHTECEPSCLARREIGRSRLLLRRGSAGQRHTSEGGPDAAIKQLCARSECGHGSLSSYGVRSEFVLSTSSLAVSSEASIVLRCAWSCSSCSFYAPVIRSSRRKWFAHNVLAE